MTQLSNRLATILTTTLNEAERRALVAVLRARPEMTLEKLQDCFAGRYGDTLRTITVGELIQLDGKALHLLAQPLEVGHASGPASEPASEHASEHAPDQRGDRAAARDGGPAIDRATLELAKQSHGIDYDELVHAAIASSGGRAVSASYLRARVGGPRWKLQGSLRRLVEAKQVDRFGVTSSTRYRIAVPRRD